MSQICQHTEKQFFFFKFVLSELLSVPVSSDNRESAVLLLTNSNFKCIIRKFTAKILTCGISWVKGPFGRYKVIARRVVCSISKHLRLIPSPTVENCLSNRHLNLKNEKSENFKILRNRKLNIFFQKKAISSSCMWISGTFWRNLRLYKKNFSNLTMEIHDSINYKVIFETCQQYELYPGSTPVI